MTKLLRFRKRAWVREVSAVTGRFQAAVSHSVRMTSMRLQKQKVTMKNLLES